MLKEKISKFTDSIKNNPSFTLKETLGYSGGIFGNTMGQDSVETFSTKFFRNFMGIDNSKITILQNVQMIANIIMNPITGNFLDKPTKPGKRPATKTIFLYAPIPFAITSMLLFIVPSSNSWYNFLWALLLRLVFGIVDGFYDMAMATMGLRMTNNPDDRKNFFTLSTLMGSLGSMLPGWVIPIVVSRTEDALLQKWLYFFVALVFCIMAIITMFAPYFTLNEKVGITYETEKEEPKEEKKEEEEEVSSNPLNWDRETVSALLHNRPFIINQSAVFFERIRAQSYNLLLFLYDDVFNDYGMKAIIDAISGALSYVGLAAVPVVSKKASAKTILSASFGYTGFFYLLMLLFGINFKVEKVRKYRYLIGLCIGLAGMPNHAINTTNKIVVADSTDYMEWYSEKYLGKPIRSDGLICAIRELLKTAFNLIATNIYNPLFKVIGYKESTVIKGTTKAVQSNRTLKGLYFMFTLFGVIGNFAASIVYLFDNFTGTKREKILFELEQMRKAREEIAKEKEQTDD